MTASAVVATSGSATANSYVTLTVADQYHEDRPAVSTTWTGTTDEEKNKALMWATTLLDSLVEWTGWPAVPATQALLWPRSGMWYRNGNSIGVTVIPTELQEATAEYARQLLVDDRGGDSDIETQGIKKIVAGPVEIEFKDNVSAKVVPDIVVSLLPKQWYGYIRGRASMTAELLRA